MPSVSKAQQRFMGLVHAYKKGDIPASQVSKAVKDAAKSMKKKSAKDFASTKHKDLPNKVREYLMSENPAASAAAAMAMMKLQNPSTGQKISAVTPLRDKDHPLHKKSKSIFQRLKDKFMKKNESVNEISGIDLAKKVVKNKQHEKGMDLFTAQYIVQTYNAYKKHPELRKKIEKLSVPKAVKLANLVMKGR